MEYTVYFYADSILQKTLKGMTAADAYNASITREMITPDTNHRNRWHVMMKNLGIPRLSTLFVGETLRIAWETVMAGQVQHYMLIQRTK